MSTTVAGIPGKDPSLPDVSLIIGGKERHLCFDFNAICTVEALTGVNLLKSSISDVSAVNVRALLYAALLPEDSTLTIDQVGAWITMRNVRNIHTALITAWFGSIESDAEENAATGEAQAQATA